jgi:hypothetical protein
MNGYYSYTGKFSVKKFKLDIKLQYVVNYINN